MTEPVALSQHQRELVLAALLDLSLEADFNRWLAGITDEDLAAMPDGANDHVGPYFDLMRQARDLRDGDHAGRRQMAVDLEVAGITQGMFQHVAAMSDGLLLWAVREVSGEDPLA